MCLSVPMQILALEADGDIAVVGRVIGGSGRT